MKPRTAMKHKPSFSRSERLALILPLLEDVTRASYKVAILQELAGED